jgi:hypothetical protein
MRALSEDEGTHRIPSKRLELLTQRHVTCHKTVLNSAVLSRPTELLESRAVNVFVLTTVVAINAARASLNFIKMFDAASIKGDTLSCVVTWSDCISVLSFSIQTELGYRRAKVGTPGLSLQKL